MHGPARPRGHHADRDPDRPPDPGGRPGLAGDPVPTRAVAAPRRGPLFAVDVPGPVGRGRHRLAVAALEHVRSSTPCSLSTVQQAFALLTAFYNPLIQDTPYPYGSDWATGGTGIYEAQGRTPDQAGSAASRLGRVRNWSGQPNITLGRTRTPSTPRSTGLACRLPTIRSGGIKPWTRRPVCRVTSPGNVRGPVRGGDRHSSR